MLVTASLLEGCFKQFIQCITVQDMSQNVAPFEAIACKVTLAGYTVVLQAYYAHSMCSHADLGSIVLRGRHHRLSNNKPSGAARALRHHFPVGLCLPSCLHLCGQCHKLHLQRQPHSQGAPTAHAIPNRMPCVCACACVCVCACDTL